MQIEPHAKQEVLFLEEETPRGSGSHRDNPNDGNPPRADVPPTINLPPSQNAEDIKSLIAAVKMVNDSVGSATAQMAKGGNSKQTAMSRRKAWKLAGMCGVPDLSKIPRVWIEMTQAPTYKDALDLFVRALTKEDQLLNAEI